MKLILAALISLVSVSAFAAFTEVECTGRNGEKNVLAVVEEGFGPGSFRRAAVKVSDTAGGEVRNYNVMSRGAFGSRVRYEGAGFDLEVDFWPDNRPQWARTYRGNFSSNDLNIPFTMMWCRFPNIRP
ncbi:MAG: hypothetical protein V4598_18175 [Bdellovibrionota bacterium]